MPLLAALALGLSHAPEARACGGMLFPAHEERVGGMSDQELFVAFMSGETVLVASAGYVQVDATRFVFLLPLAAAPSYVGDADPALFIALEEHTAPEVSIYVDHGKPPPSLGCGMVGDAGPGDGQIMIQQRGRTATYEYVVIGGDTGSAIIDWLSQEGYAVPPDYAAALDPYVSDGWFFFVAKVLPTAPFGGLAPIELHLPAAPPEAFEIPLSIAGYSLPPGEPLRLTTYIWSEGPLVPEGYASAAIDDDELVAFSDTETNYDTLERAVLESDPSGAWIIDMSLGTSPVELEQAYADALEAGRANPTFSDAAFVQDFFHRLGGGDAWLTRVRTELRADQLRDMPFRRAPDTFVTRTHEATFQEDEEEGCAVGRHRGLPAMLMLALLIALRPRRRATTGERG